MKAANTTRTRRDTLNLRILPAERKLIDRAAEAAGKTRTAFILEAARRAAEETLRGRALMVAGAEAYGEFLKRLDNPAQPNGSLLRTRSAEPTSAQAKVPR
ncbi:MAG TPA: DUF1778 domain-containing protein [Burkholderiaceae bacterium]|nr:DUF1778 domain-containing protein [Burkholderiaceae bacterium]